MIHVTYRANVHMWLLSFKFSLGHGSFSLRNCFYKQYWKNKNPVTSITYHGAHNRIRTGDLFLTKEVLYRLSYMGQDPAQADLERVMGIEPTPSAWKAEVLPLNYTRLDSTRQPDSHHL